MRENRTYGSEGAGPGQPGLATPIEFTVAGELNAPLTHAKPTPSAAETKPSTRARPSPKRRRSEPARRLSRQSSG